MKTLSKLYFNLDATNSTLEKQRILVEFFKAHAKEDTLWLVGLFTHRRSPRIVNTRVLRQWASDVSSTPLWLLEESYHIVGDLAETLALLVSKGKKSSLPNTSLAHWMQTYQSLQKASELEIKNFVLSMWQQMDYKESFVFHKIITGGMRVGVSDKLMSKALAKFLEKDENEITYRLTGNWKPWNTTFERLFILKDKEAALSKPYPFYLAYPVDDDIEKLGAEINWTAEYKWDGIRGQLILRNQNTYLWSRGEEEILNSFPEFKDYAQFNTHDIVLDGELLAYKDHPLPFNQLQKRLGRKNPGKKICKNIPVFFMVYDVFEYQREDIRHLSLSKRKNIIKQWHQLNALSMPNILLSPELPFSHWKELKTLQSNARENHAEGLMLKKQGSAYLTGRKKGEWWKWKVEPLHFDGVLTYAMRGHGRRANLYTDFTFAVWKNNELITVCKAYSGLTDEELKEVDRFVKKNTLEKYGPVRKVKPELVFEIAFEGIAESNRHKSGLAMRFPRIARFRKDKTIEEADQIENLRNLLSL